MSSLPRNRFSHFLLVIGTSLALGVLTVRGQSVLDGFDPNANGAIRAIVVQTDGKILIGGDFTTLAPNGSAPVTRNHIARLNPDGMVDAGFDPNANGAVYAIAVAGEGKIFVGGNFSGGSSIGGKARNFIARLDDTGAAGSFDPNANGAVFAIAVQSDGKILAGGLFNGANSIGGQTRNYIARLDGTTGIADSFDPNANGAVHCIVVQWNNRILVGGQFNGVNSIGELTRNRIARLDPATGLADSFDPNANDIIYTIAVEEDGKVLAGGQFNGADSIGGQTRNRIARLDPTTGLADSFDPNTNSTVHTIVVQADGKILVGGAFNSSMGPITIGGQTRNGIARLDPATGLADSLDSNAGNNVLSIATQADGKILAGGAFVTLSPSGGAAVPRNYIARLETDGRLDRAVNLNIVAPIYSSVTATAIQADGKILIGGGFSSVLGVTRNNLARLNTDGTLDITFNPNVNDFVNSIAVLADGKILICGYFTSIGDRARKRIARLDPVTGLAEGYIPDPDNYLLTAAPQVDGKILVCGGFTNIGNRARTYIARLDPITGLADSFNPNPNVAMFPNVYTIALQADGKILVGGQFTSIGGQARGGIARLDPITGLADSFNPGQNRWPNCLMVQPDGKILVGGFFHGQNSIGGQSRNYIARLNPVTGLADSFDPNASKDVNSIAMQSDGRIFASGNFETIGGQTRGRIARLGLIFGLADSFNPNASGGDPTGYVYSTVLQPDGKALMSGGFTSVNGNPLNLFARASNDIAALQDLIVTQSTVSWMRSGSSPLLNRVTFEYSTDNVNYTVLGVGVATGSNWALTGLALPIQQSIFIRARGYYRTGYLNGSESITETVRNVYLRGAALTGVVSRKLHGGMAFGVDLPLTGNPGVECRSGGINGDYQMIFSFLNPLTSVGNASLTSGTGSVGSHMMDADSHNYIVNLTGVTNQQVITVSLTNVNDAAGNSTGSVSISMGVLLGDVTGNGTVNATDVSQVRPGRVVDDSNFRQDVTVNGFINSSDVSAVKLQSGTALP